MKSVLNPSYGHMEDQLLTVHPAVHGVIANRKQPWTSRKVMNKEEQELVFLWQQRFLREKTWSWPIIVQAAKDELPLNARFWATCSEIDQLIKEQW